MVERITPSRAFSLSLTKCKNDFYNNSLPFFTWFVADSNFSVIFCDSGQLVLSQSVVGDPSEIEWASICVEALYARYPPYDYCFTTRISWKVQWDKAWLCWTDPQNNIDPWPFVRIESRKKRETKKIKLNGAICRGPAEAWQAASANDVSLDPIYLFVYFFSWFFFFVLRSKAIIRGEKMHFM